MRGYAKHRFRVYVAGPLTIGDQAVNVRNAILAADTLLERGYYPYVPHLNHLWHLIKPQSYEAWLELDFGFLETCEAVLRLPGVSKGADREVAFAEGRRIPVYYSLNDFPKMGSASAQS